MDTEKEDNLLAQIQVLEGDIGEIMAALGIEYEERGNWATCQELVEKVDQALRRIELVHASVLTILEVTRALNARIG